PHSAAQVDGLLRKEPKEDLRRTSRFFHFLLLQTLLPMTGTCFSTSLSDSMGGPDGDRSEGKRASLGGTRMLWRNSSNHVCRSLLNGSSSSLCKPSASISASSSTSTSNFPDDT